MSTRLARGGRLIDRSSAAEFTFNGKRLRGYPHQQVLLAHPDAGFKTFEDLAGASKYILSKDGFISYFSWMKSAYPAFTDDKFEPYTFNPAPFIADKQAIQWMLATIVMLGSLLATDLLCFYVFWEVMLVPMYLIVGIWGGEQRIYATIKFFLYTMFGSLLMLLVALIVVVPEVRL